MSSTEAQKCMLVTGGAGFLGSHVVDRAMAEGFHVTVVDNLYTGVAANLAAHMDSPNFRFFQHNVQFPFPADVTAGPARRAYSVIFHLACPASPVHYQRDPIGTTLTCVNGTNHALELATQHGCPILISSTSEVYGDPVSSPQREEDWGNVNCRGLRSCYDEGKRCAESLCFDYNRRYGTRIRVARIFNTYGPRMCFNDGRIISNFLVQALEGRDVTIYGTGAYTRSFQYVDDLVEGFWRLVHHPSEIGPVNLGNPEEFSVKEMAEKVLALVPDSPSKIVYMPAAADDPKQRRPDIEKAKRVLQWQPMVRVDEGLQRTLDEFKHRMGK